MAVWQTNLFYRCTQCFELFDGGLNLSGDLRIDLAGEKLFRQAYFQPLEGIIQGQRIVGHRFIDTG